VAANVQSGIRFAVAQGTLPWQPILRAKAAKSAKIPSLFLGLAFHKGWQDGKAHGRINTADVVSTWLKNLVNFGPLTPGFTTLI